MTTRAAGIWEKTWDGAPLWVPSGANRCEACGGEGALYGIALGETAETSSECTSCDGAGYVAGDIDLARPTTRRRTISATEDLKAALRGSLTLARAGVVRFARVAR